MRYLFSVIILALHSCKGSIILIDCDKLEKYKIDKKCDFIVLNKDLFARLTSKILKPSHPLGITRLVSTQRAHPGKVSPANRICSPDKGAKQACQARRARQASTPGSASPPSKHARLREHAKQACQAQRGGTPG